MPILSDLPIQIPSGANHVEFVTNPYENKILQPGDYIAVGGDLVGGIISFHASGRNKDNPFYSRGRPENRRTYHNCIPLRVELFRGNESTPVFSGHTPEGTKEESHFSLRQKIDAGAVIVDRMDSRTKWILRVTNDTSEPILADTGMTYIRDATSIGHTDVPLRVLNHAFGVVLDALTPFVIIEGSQLRGALSSEIKEFFPDEDLSFQKDISPFEGSGRLLSLEVKLVDGQTLLNVVEATWQAISQAVERYGNAFPTLTAIRNKYREWRDDWLGKVEPDDVVLYSKTELSTVTAEASIGIATIPLGSVHATKVDTYIAFNKNVSQYNNCHILFDSPARYKGLAGFANNVGLLPSIEGLLNGLTEKIEPKAGFIHKYFGEILARMSPFLSELPAIFIDARVAGDAVKVRYCQDPDAIRASRPRAQPTGGGTSTDGASTGGGGRFGRLRETVGDVARDADRTSDGSVAVEPERPGEIPSGFEIGDSLSVSRLDQIETIVVVMMENRSYDHMLGYLQGRDPKYDGFTAAHLNKYVDSNGQEHTVKMQPIKDLIRSGFDYMSIPDDPYHGYDHVRQQINGGAMDGFAADLLKRPGANPEFALSYYDGEQLWMYDELATKYKVCTRWFCAHPGGTYPNRWATLHGTMPDLKNIGIDDPRMGFIRAATIFDVLNQEGIGWNYYEKNVSMIRMYNSFRLDDKNVVPFYDENEGFLSKAAAGTLPPVVFIEPQITGIPPLAQCSDDHPPANLSMGQLFINEVYNALVNSPQWRSCLLVITYDEHGGFFDHVPPPGTVMGPADWRERVPEIITDGPKYMGPRVPTFVVSPFVHPGSTSDQVFDHTSIIKTILVRHRNHLTPSQFNLFGKRVAMINHLGVALDTLEPRQEAQIQPRAPVGPAVFPPNFNPRAIPAEASSNGSGEIGNFGVSLARAMLPKK